MVISELWKFIFIKPKQKKKEKKKPVGHVFPLVKQMTCLFINETITRKRGSKDNPSSLYNPWFSQAMPFNWAIIIPLLIVEKVTLNQCFDCEQLKNEPSHWKYVCFIVYLSSMQSGGSHYVMVLEGYRSPYAEW